MSFENLVTIVVGLVTVASAVGSAWLILSNKIDKNEETLANRIGENEQAINDFKLQVAKEYASIGYLKDVEERLVKAIEGLSQSVDTMPGKVAEIINANNRPRR